MPLKPGTSRNEDRNCGTRSRFNQTRSPLQKWYLRQVRYDGEVLANSVVSELTTLG